MREPVPYQIPNEVIDIIKDPVADRDGFYQYVKKCLKKQLSVYECTVLLAGLDVVGKSIMADIEEDKDYGKYRERWLLKEQKDLACCEYLADELRAVRRGVTASEMDLLTKGSISVRRFVNSVVMPMLSRTWLPAAWYEPAIGDQINEAKAWQGQRIPDFDRELEIVKNPAEYGELLERAGVRGRGTDEASPLDGILSALRKWNLGGVSRETASYLSSVRLVKTKTKGIPLEVPILLVCRNRSKWELGHVLRAMLVPFAAPCTSELNRESLIPAREAVERHFAGSYPLPRLCHLVVGDYPGGVYCPGGAVCIEAEERCEGECEKFVYGPSQFEGPSAGLAFGVLLASEALGVKMPPHSYATAKLTSEGEVKALGNRQSDKVDPYLKAKGRTIALFAHASGCYMARVLVANDDHTMFLLGVEQYLREVKQYSQESNQDTREENWSFSCSCQGVRSLQEALNYLLPDMYGNIIATLTSSEFKDSSLAKEAAHRILVNPLGNRWVISVPAWSDRVCSESENFETDLAREIYRLSRTQGGAIRIPVCLSAHDFYMDYHTHSSKTGTLGQTVARLGGIDLSDCIEQCNARLSQIEKDLYEGGLILILRGLTGYDSMGNLVMGPNAYGEIEQLLDDLRSESNDKSDWKIKAIVTVRRTGGEKASQQVLKMLTTYGFKECNLADVPIGECKT